MQSNEMKEQLLRTETAVAAGAKLRDLSRTDFINYDNFVENADKVAALGLFALILLSAALFFAIQKKSFEQIKKLKRPRWAPKYGMGYFGIYLLRTMSSVASVSVMVLKNGDITIQEALSFGFNTTFGLLYVLGIVFMGDVSTAMLMALLGMLTCFFEMYLLSEQSYIASQICSVTIVITGLMLTIVGRMWYHTEFKQALQEMGDIGGFGKKITDGINAKTAALDAAVGGGKGKKKTAKIPSKADLERIRRSN